MRTVCTAVLLSFALVTARAQNVSIESILKLPEVKENYYAPVQTGSKAVYLPMHFGKSEFGINQLAVINELKKAQVVRVDLVYSDYPSKMDFSPLNRKRLESLYKILPGLFRNEIEFRKIRQTAFNNKETASYLPHGFYIYYRPLPDSIETVKELKRIDKLLHKTVRSDSLGAICGEWGFYIDSIDFHPLRKDFTRSVIRISTSEGIKSKLITKEYYEYVENSDSVYYVLDMDEDRCNSWDGVERYESFENVVEQVFNRQQWDKAMIVADVTGSMYPYSAQLLTWLKLKMSDGLKRNFIFFNDGDDKADAEKIVGNTGGIHDICSAKYDEIENKLKEAMISGSGGDAPENNVEALLFAIKKCPSCDTVVMIADNWAPVKDIGLATSIKKPVKIILCGVYDKINTDYLNLARKTKGSIHLMEQDIYELSLMREGEVIEIKGHKYKIEGGEFKEIPVVRI
ncbi:MAG: hypothetical protein JST86_06110 [Bacteroidetes bacterium]|nr:hypothetical protein [Bacteroidota bacterium]